MSYATVANVKKATANADLIPGPHSYEAVRIVNGANTCTVKLRKSTSSGEIIWQSAPLAANAVEYDQLPIYMSGVDIYVDMSAAGAVVFLYSKEG